MPAIADDGRVYQPPLGNSRYVYPFNYHKFKVPQKLGYGFYPTYWRDWHDNPDAVLTELRPNRKPYQKKKKQKPEPAATKPADAENAATEDDTLPPPPVEPELPPQETHATSENLELPSEPHQTTTPPTLEPAPASAPETETPATPTEPEATTPDPDTGEPAPSAKPAADDPLSLPPL